MMIHIENRWNYTDIEKPKYCEQHPSQTLSAKNHTCTEPAPNPDLGRQRAATNRLSEGAGFED